MKQSAIILILTLAGFWIVFFGLQNSKIYNRTLGIVSRNLENINGKKKRVDKPFLNLDNTNYLNWDGEHYHSIKENGYNYEKIKGDYIFAFFPLFPVIWNISQLPPIGILFLNYLLFSVSVLILLKLFSEKEDYKKHLLISLSLPGLVIFLMPYTEAVFLLMTTIGIYGFIKKKYWIFFLGFFLASLTRPSFVFLVLSILGAEIFFLIEYKKIAVTLKNIVCKLLPIFTGILIVSGIQYFQGSGSVTKFIEVQKKWKNILSLPSSLSDWSLEGFAINVGILFLLFVPLLALFFWLIYHQVKLHETKKKGFSKQIRHYYIIVLSLFYLIGSILFIVFFRNGSLHGLFRFTLCTPFMFVLVFSLFKPIKEIAVKFRIVGFISLSLLSILVLTFADYSQHWSFSNFGILLLIFAIFFWLFQDYSSYMAYRINLYLILVLNIIWTTYLFNIYISNGWIFT